MGYDLTTTEFACPLEAHRQLRKLAKDNDYILLENSVEIEDLSRQVDEYHIEQYVAKGNVL